MTRSAAHRRPNNPQAPTAPVDPALLPLLKALAEEAARRDYAAASQKPSPKP